MQYYETISPHISGYYKLLMLDEDGEEEEEEDPYKIRLKTLKSYISSIKQQIGFYQPLHTPTSTKQKPQLIQNHTITIRPPTNPNQSKQQKQKQRLLKQIQAKQNQIGLNLFNKNDSIKDAITHLSIAQVFISNTKIYETLQKIKRLLAPTDWELCKIYKKVNKLVLLGTRCLYVDYVQISTIKMQSLEICDQLMVFSTLGSKQRHYVFKFINKQIAVKWFIFLKNLVNSFQSKQLSQKWNTTKLKPKLPQKEVKQKEGLISPINKEMKKIPQLNLLSPLKMEKQKQITDNNKLFSIKNTNKRNILQKQSISSSSFFLSNSSDKNQQQKKQYFTIIQQELFHSFKFGFAQKKNHHSQMQDLKKTHNLDIKQTVKYQNNPKNDGQDSLVMTTKLVEKLTEKNKLLSESSTTKLGIHWYEDTEQNEHHPTLNMPQITPERFILSPNKIVRNKVSVSTTKRNQSSTRRDSNQSPLKIKRVESATRQKSNSRESDSNMEFERGLRKKTDFSLTIESGDSPGRRKTTRQQIQDSYLQRLLDKQGIIRQISKSSSKNSSEKPGQGLLALPQKKRISQHSKQSSASKLPQVSVEQESNSQQQERDSVDNEVQIQQLKNGIVLQKCSKNSWSTKQKKLYISNTMSQLCYCDVNNLHEQKKYLIRDVMSVEYGRVTRGILKHKKKRCDEGRCLVIRIDNEGKQKFLQFYLEETQPIQNLSEFANKLQKFIESHHKQQTHQQIQQD